MERFQMKRDQDFQDNIQGVLSNKNEKQNKKTKNISESYKKMIIPDNDDNFFNIDNIESMADLNEVEERDFDLLSEKREQQLMTDDLNDRSLYPKQTTEFKRSQKHNKSDRSNNIKFVNNHKTIDIEDMEHDRTIKKKSSKKNYDPYLTSPST